VIGSPVAGRQRVELESLIGLFINMLALRVSLEDNPTIIDLLHRVKQLTLEGYAHQDLPFEQVVEAIQPLRTLSHSPVFQTMFAFQNTLHGELELPDLKLITQEVPRTKTQFDLTLWLAEKGDTVTGNLEYASDLFDRSTIERWVEHFKTILANMVRHAERPVNELAFLGEQERAQVVSGFNATDITYGTEQLVYVLFERQAAQAPDRVALVAGNQQLTYGELNRRANQLARHLRAHGALCGAWSGHGGRPAGHSEGRRRLCAVGPVVSSRSNRVHADRCGAVRNRHARRTCQRVAGHAGAGHRARYPME
jgi:non-ribosomal peptide synthetase component F